MGCECSVTVDVDEYADQCFVSVRPSRKARQCGECGGAISGGERYELAKLLTDGSWDRYITCLPCAEIRAAYFCTWHYGEMWEDLQCSLFEDGLKMAGKCWEKLSCAGKTKLLAGWRKWKGL